MHPRDLLSCHQLKWDRFGRETSQFLKANLVMGAAVRVAPGSQMRGSILWITQPATPMVSPKGCGLGNQAGAKPKPLLTWTP